MTGAGANGPATLGSTYGAIGGGNNALTNPSRDNIF